ncbi:response regulator [Maridesulfovibrio zosterae]|uniref:response regulator n=1 Tax=Maridesulfovibrio zosterae TaxID=82171 RepID=UPI0004009CF4|nr:response regulator [Maridesulfovibrio zosterae]
MINSDFSKIKLLIAEDSRPVRLVLKTYISKLGIETEYVTTGTEALQKLQTGRFNLAFMDVHMPEMDGRDVVRKTRKNGIAIPIIAMTTGDNPDLLISCLDAGYNSFLLKPIKKDELLQIINKFNRRLS